MFLLSTSSVTAFSSPFYRRCASKSSVKNRTPRMPLFAGTSASAFLRSWRRCPPVLGRRPQCLQRPPWPFHSIPRSPDPVLNAREIQDAVRRQYRNREEKSRGGNAFENSTYVPTFAEAAGWSGVSFKSLADRAAMTSVSVSINAIHRARRINVNNEAPRPFPRIYLPAEPRLLRS